MGFDYSRKSCASLQHSLPTHQKVVTSSGLAGIFGALCEQSQWLPLTQNQIKNNEMDGACGGEVHTVFGGET